MTKWLANLQPRERRVLVFGALSLAAMLGYLFLFEPFMAERDQLINRVQAQRTLRAQLARIAGEAKALRAGAGRRDNAVQGTLLAVVSKTSRSGGIKESMKRIAPEGGKKARLWFENVSFDKLMAWLAAISGSNGIKVENINVTAEDTPGLVRVKLTLTAPDA
ncbi:MAG TPA: type II secretion system protein M [Sedimenticola sp.]|nr:type II secretion system protein M [Sedimenticola sp.]